MRADVAAVFVGVVLVPAALGAAFETAAFDAVKVDLEAAENLETAAVFDAVAVERAAVVFAAAGEVFDGAFDAAGRVAGFAATECLTASGARTDAGFGCVDQWASGLKRAGARVFPEAALAVMATASAGSASTTAVAHRTFTARERNMDTPLAESPALWPDGTMAAGCAWWRDAASAAAVGRSIGRALFAR